MTDISIPYRFKSDKLYTTDIGQTANFNLSLKKPSDITDENAQKIIECIGELRVSGSVPCSERGLITPRKITFIRQNGNSFSLIFPDRDTLIKDAQCVWDILKDIKENPPICAKLFGEKHKDLIADLNLEDREGDSVTNSPIKPPEDVGKHRLVYSGVMKEYKSDSVKSGNKTGGIVFQSFTMQTDTEPDDKGVKQPYSELKKAIVNCHGDLTTIRSCGGNINKRKARYFEPQIAVKITDTNNQLNPLDNESTELLQSLSIPIADNTAAKIKECGEAIAKNLWVVCLPYHGEDYGLFHKLLS